MNFLKKSAFTFATQIGSMMMGMAGSVVVARALGPELKGQAALLALLAQTLFMLCSMGMGSAFSFFIAKQRYLRRAILSAALAYSLFFGGLGLLIFYISWPLHASIWERIPENLIFVSSLLAIAYIYTNYLYRILIGYGRIYEMNAYGLTGSAANFIAMLLLVWMLPLGLTGYVEAQCFSTIVQVLVLFWLLRTDLRPARFWGQGLIRDSLGYGIKSYALLLVNFLNYRIDMLLLKHFADDTSVGYYSLAVGMAELMWMLPNATVAPLFSDLARSNAADRSLITLRTVRWSLLFLSILASAGILLGRHFIALLYGTAFLPSYIPFLWLLPGICLFPIFKLLAIDLSARGNPGYGTTASFAALITNIVANIILIPIMGASGAALASSCSYSLMATLCLIFFIRVTKYRVRDIFVFDTDERNIILHFIPWHRWRSTSKVI